jgi:MarR family 2-MHQ and catechol resistance regulon transcriptional repressor
MSKPISSSALRLWVVLSRAFAAVEARVKADVARHGLTPAEFGVLEALYHKGPLLLGEIKEKILVTSGGVTYLVDRLEGKGLVERRRCPSDRRASFAALTEEGAALMQRIFPEHVEMLADTLSGLAEAEQAQAAALLRTLGRRAAGMD